MGRENTTDFKNGLGTGEYEYRRYQMEKVKGENVRRDNYN